MYKLKHLIQNESMCTKLCEIIDQSYYSDTTVAVAVKD